VPNALLTDLVALVGAEHVLAGDAARPYETDGTASRGLSGTPDAVVLPADAEEVAAVVAWAVRTGTPLVPRGGGSGLAGGAVPVEGGVVVATERLDRIVSLEPEAWRMTVGAGVRTATVHRLAREHGLLFPPDPGAAEQSTIGGNVATNAGGPHAFGYGATGAWVTGVEAVVPPGEVVRVGGALRKDVGGLDLTHLLVGSEGTLGIVTAATLRLVPAPAVVRPLVGFFPDAAAGTTALTETLGGGVQPAALDYLDGRSRTCATRGRRTRWRSTSPRPPTCGAGATACTARSPACAAARCPRTWSCRRSAWPRRSRPSTRSATRRASASARGATRATGTCTRACSSTPAIRPS
jgi:FAD/FMN-containing dehydrogenase